MFSTHALFVWYVRVTVDWLTCTCPDVLLFCVMGAALTIPLYRCVTVPTVVLWFMQLLLIGIVHNVMCCVVLMSCRPVGVVCGCADVLLLLSMVSEYRHGSSIRAHTWRACSLVVPAVLAPQVIILVALSV